MLVVAKRVIVIEISPCAISLGLKSIRTENKLLAD